MDTLLANMFVHPMSITGIGRIAMLAPLCLSVALVYKTIRCERLSEIPKASVMLWVTILACMMLIGAGLFVVSNMLA
jgi:nitric oxide reductase large subunit